MVFQYLVESGLTSRSTHYKWFIPNQSHLLTGTKHPAFSTNHLTDTDKTKHNYNQEQHKNLNHLAQYLLQVYQVKQESPAIADKPTRRESLPKIAPIRRAYNVVADDTGLSSFV